MILTEKPTELDDHPLTGLSTEQRDAVRAQAFGRVLAAIALRKTGSKPDDEQDLVERSPRNARSKSNQVPNTGQ